MRATDHGSVMEDTRPLVLVADDDPDIVALIAFQLRRSGLRTVVASDGLEALRAITRERPDLALLDVAMPGLDGDAVCRILQAQGDAAPPVIFVSARAAVADRVKGLADGAIDYVTKPFHVAELVARVHAVLRGRARSAA